MGCPLSAHTSPSAASYFVTQHDWMGQGDGGKGGGGVEILGRSAYMNQEEFPILTLAEPLITGQYSPALFPPSS